MEDETKPVPVAPTTAPATRPAWLSDPKQTHVQTQWKYGSPIISCRIDPTGRFVFAGAEDRSIQRWEIASGKQAAFVGHESWVKALAFSKDGQTLISGGY